MPATELRKILRHGDAGETILKPDLPPGGVNA